MSDCGLLVTSVTASWNWVILLRFTCFTFETASLFFPDSWDDYATELAYVHCRRVRPLFDLQIMLYSVEPIVISFGLVLVGLLCCFPLLLCAWTRTSLLAGESEVVLSGVDRL